MMTSGPQGGYNLDSKGLPHVTFQSPLHCGDGESLAHAVIKLYPDEVVIEGEGLVPSRRLSKTNETIKM